MEDKLLKLGPAPRPCQSVSGCVQTLLSPKLKKINKNTARARVRFQIKVAVINRWRWVGFFFSLRLLLPTRTFTSAFRLQSQSAFLCTLIIDSWRRQVLPFPPFCVYLFSTLSETRRATPRCRNDTAMINRYDRAAALWEIPPGVMVVPGRYDKNKRTAECFRIVAK